MHPQYKLSYFSEKEWPQEWIDTAIEIARRIWREHYQPRLRTHGPRPASVSFLLLTILTFHTQSGDTTEPSG